MKTILTGLAMVLLSSHAAAESDIESALAGCAAIKNAKQKAGCYEAVTKLATQAKPAAAPPQEAEPAKVSQYAEFIAKAKHNITRDFKDPASVLWRNLFVSGDQMPVLCGELNGKNSYGAFVGFRRFYAAENAALQEIEDPKHPEMMNGMWKTMCGKKVENIGEVEDVDPSPPSTTQKAKWLTVLAEKNGCEGKIRVRSTMKEGTKEKFEVTCADKNLVFTCDFRGPITEQMGGIPFVRGESGHNQAACWM